MLLRRFALVLLCGFLLRAADRLPWVTLDGNYFAVGCESGPRTYACGSLSRRFVPVGVNWVPAKAGMLWPVDWEPKEIEADFAKMHELGFNAVRVNLLWGWFEPRSGDYNPEAFRQLDYLISLGQRYRVYLVPQIFIGGAVGEAFWDVPWREGRNPQSDAEMLAFETDLAGEFGRRYANESAILAWDLTNEPPFWIAPGTTDAMALNWTRLITGAIRKFDHRHPIVAGTSMQDVERGPFRPDVIGGEVDFFSVHPYTIYAPELFPGAMLSGRGTYGAAFEAELSRGAGKPVMIEEVGASSAQYTPERIAAYERVALYSSLGAGANGFLIWCFTDAAPSQYSRVPYVRSPHETQFGVTDWLRRERPQALGLQEFGQVVRRLDLTGMAPAAADAGIVVPNEWAKRHGDFSHFGLSGPAVVPYTSTEEVTESDLSDANRWLQGSWISAFVLAHRAGFQVDFPREYGGWNKRPMVLLPSPLTSTETYFIHVHTDFWQKAKAYVAAGGVLYASVAADAAIPDMSDLFGARLMDAAPVSELTLKFVHDLGNVKAGMTLHYTVPGVSPRYSGALLELQGGQVIAVDQNDRPAVVANVVGKGKVLLCAYPIETYLANVPGGFEGSENTHRLYAGLREWAGLESAFATDNPAIEIETLTAGDRGYVVLVNHGSEAQTFRLSGSSTVHSISEVGSDGLHSVARAQSGWSVSLEAFAGAVFEWR